MIRDIASIALIVVGFLISIPLKTYSQSEVNFMATKLELTSKDILSNSPIPVVFSGEGKNISPQLSWTGVPSDCKELILVVDDPDAPLPGGWIHWVVYGIPPELKELPQAVTQGASGIVFGKNSYGKNIYQGPMPPPGSGAHHYHFKLFAIDKTLDLKPGIARDQIYKQIQGHILGQAELVGTYKR